MRLHDDHDRSGKSVTIEKREKKSIKSILDIFYC